MCATAVVLAAGTFPAPAAADPQIERLRFGRHPQFDRIVLDLESNDVAAYVTSDRRTLSVEADPPPLASAARRKLSRLGVRVEASPGRLRLTPDAGREWSTFRLEGVRPRIVVDLGAGAPPLPIDGTRIVARSGPDASATNGNLPTVDAARASPRRDVRTDRPPATQIPSGTRPGAGGSKRETSRRAPPGRERARTRTLSAAAAQFKIRIREIEFDGLGATGSRRDELLALELPVRLAPSGYWEASTPDADDTRTLTLRQLASPAPQAPGLLGSVLQQIVERIARFYLERGRLGTCVDIRGTDLAPLLDERGTLVVRINKVCEDPY